MQKIKKFRIIVEELNNGYKNYYVQVYQNWIFGWANLYEYNTGNFTVTTLIYTKWLKEKDAVNAIEKYKQQLLNEYL